MNKMLSFRFALLAVCMLALTSLGFTQVDEKPRPQVIGTIAQDKPSPPMSTTGKIGPVEVAVNYSSPAVKGRQIWGQLVPYGKVWRTGANEATVVSFDKDVLVEGQRLPAGKYSLYTIPGEKEWTVIFNKATGQWGTQYNQEQDAARVKVKPVASKTMNERLKIEVADKGKNTGALTISWENLQVPVTVKPASAS